MTNVTIDSIKDMPVPAEIELGRASMNIGDLLQLKSGSIFELIHPEDEPLDLMVEDLVIAQGKVVVIDGEFGFRITKIVSNIDPEAI